MTPQPVRPVASEICTIGVYGFSEATFFAALQAHGVNLLCDVRWRRGVRGRDYAFANSRRLQARLAELDIGYLHRRDLAPPPELRRLQQAADAAGRVKKRERQQLTPAFITAYQDTVLAEFDAQAFLDELDRQAAVVALLCVERDPRACHRSLLANQLTQVLKLSAEHILP
jgi:uncharacterized protein (DUF488 family)